MLHRFALNPFSIILTVGLLASTTAFAQVTVPFQVTPSSGTLDRFPVFPDDVGGPGILHDITVGGATIDGQALNYTSLGSIRVLDVPDANGTVPFESDLPVTFDFGGGNTLAMHYGRIDMGAPTTGFVTLSPGSTPNRFDLEFLATFTYVPGSGTGDYADVIDAEFFMTANMDEVDITTPDLPYMWSSDVGFLTFVPEPNSGLLFALAMAAAISLRRRW